MLKGKQRAFVAEYLKDLNATQAAIRAGYSKKTAASQGQRLLKNVEVASALETAQEKREEKAEITAEYIDKALMEVAERCMTRRAVMVRDGREIVQKQEEIDCDCSDPKCKGTRTVGVWDFDSAGANSALKLMAQRVRGYMAPTKTEVTGKDGQPLPAGHTTVNLPKISFAGWTPAQIDKFIEATSKA